MLCEDIYITESKSNFSDTMAIATNNAPTRRMLEEGRIYNWGEGRIQMKQGKYPTNEEVNSVFQPILMKTIRTSEEIEIVSTLPFFVDNFFVHGKFNAKVDFMAENGSGEMLMLPGYHIAESSDNGFIYIKTLGNNASIEKKTVKGIETTIIHPLSAMPVNIEVAPGEAGLIDKLLGIPVKRADPDVTYGADEIGYIIYRTKGNSISWMSRGAFGYDLDPMYFNAVCPAGDEHRLPTLIFEELERRQKQIEKQ